MILFINATCGNKSRTARIARAYLHEREDITELNLEREYLEPLNSNSLELRDQCIRQGKLTHPYFDLAHQFAQADEIVIAAPFWDLSFPARLRVYLENICISGLTFRYSEQGIPQGLCRAKKLTYITTSGGPFLPNFGYDYIRALATTFFGIPETELIYAEGLDIVTNDAESIVADCIASFQGEEPSDARIPNVIGLQAGNAASRCRRLGYRVIISGSQSDSVAMVHPAPGTKLASGSEICLVTAPK